MCKFYHVPLVRYNYSKRFHEKTIFDNKNNFKKCKTTSVDLEKTFKYLKIPESLRLENFTEQYLCKGLFLHVFLQPKRFLQKHRIKKS